MNWILETAKCIFTVERKDNKNSKIPKSKKFIPLNDENFKLIKECSWIGCNLEFYERRPIYKKARLYNKYYAFCCDECYNTWLKSNYFFY